MKICNYLLVALFAFNLMQVRAQCAATGSHYTASYPSGWTITDQGDGAINESTSCTDNRNGTLYLDNTAAYFISARSGRELRASRAIPTVSNAYWTMDFTLIINPSFYSSAMLSTNSPSVVLAALTADPVSLQSGCNTPGVSPCTPCSSYQNTNTDAMWVYLTSNPPSSWCNESQTGKNWRIVGAARDGNGIQNNSTAINIPTTAGTYYVRLQRTDLGNALISVFSNSNFTGHLAGSPQCISIPGSVTNLDVLTHEVHAQEECRRTFNGIVDHLKIDNSVTCPTVLTPSLICPASICGVVPFNVNGSASAIGNNLGVGSHRWVVEESNASGNQFGPVWYGNPVGGAPPAVSTITPAVVAANGGPVMQVGHYYKVSLVLSNCGNPWSATSKVVYIKCTPTISMNGSSTVVNANNGFTIKPTVTSCGGTPNVVSITVPGFYPYTIASGSIYNYTQTSTKTYVISATSSNGCTTNLNWTITGGHPWTPQPKPAFNVVLTSESAADYTIEKQTVDDTGAESPGFGFTHILQEVAVDGTPLYEDISPECWNNYPAPEDYKGFAGNPDGSFSQLPYPECGEPGKFLKGHRYRLTTGMWNDEYAEERYSVIIYYDLDLQQLIVESDNYDETMERRSAAGGAGVTPAEITISPNPSTGIFTIELSEKASGSAIVVMDAAGKKVKTLAAAAGTRSELDLTGFSRGIYMVNITGSDGKTITKKIVLE